MNDKIISYDELCSRFEQSEASNLCKYAMMYKYLDIQIFNDDAVYIMAENLLTIGEALSHEESVNLGLGNDARLLRKMWRRQVRMIKRDMKQTIKARKQYNKEWRNPKRIEYISRNTGECHNGLYWTIRAVLDRPIIAKEGFYKEVKW